MQKPTRPLRQPQHPRISSPALFKQPPRARDARKCQGHKTILTPRSQPLTLQPRMLVPVCFNRDAQSHPTAPCRNVTQTGQKGGIPAVPAVLLEGKVKISLDTETSRGKEKEHTCTAAKLPPQPRDPSPTAARPRAQSGAFLGRNPGALPSCASHGAAPPLLARQPAHGGAEASAFPGASEEEGGGDGRVVYSMWGGSSSKRAVPGDSGPAAPKQSAAFGSRPPREAGRDGAGGPRASPTCYRSSPPPPPPPTPPASCRRTLPCRAALLPAAPAGEEPRWAAVMALGGRTTASRRRRRGAHSASAAAAAAAAGPGPTPSCPVPPRAARALPARRQPCAWFRHHPRCPRPVKGGKSLPNVGDAAHAVTSQWDG